MFIIRIDPHKGSHTAVVVDCREAVVATIRVDADRHQRDRLVEWAARFEPRTWAAGLTDRRHDSYSDTQLAASTSGVRSVRSRSDHLLTRSLQSRRGVSATLKSER